MTRRCIVPYVSRLLTSGGRATVYSNRYLLLSDFTLVSLMSASAPQSFEYTPHWTGRVFVTSSVYEIIDRYLDLTLSGIDPPPSRMLMIHYGEWRGAENSRVVQVVLCIPQGVRKNEPTTSYTMLRTFPTIQIFTPGITSLSSCLSAGTGLIKVSLLIHREITCRPSTDPTSPESVDLHASPAFPVAR